MSEAAVVAVQRRVLASMFAIPRPPRAILAMV
jgi:hypothetical protein